MSAPFSTLLPGPSEPLYGRSAITDELLMDAMCGRKISLTGLRRVGKTSLVRRVCEILESDSDNRYHSYPLYLDMKQTGIKGTADFYRYLVAQLTARMFEKEFFKENWIIKDVTLETDDDCDDIYEKLLPIARKCQRLFETVVDKASEIMGRTVILVLDEYEYLFEKILDDPNGFMRIRDMSTKPVNDNGLCRFSFWMIGAREWDCFHNDIGSGFGNTVESYKHLAPLTEADFAAMWEAECDKIEDETAAMEIRRECARAFRSCGGIPFFGKLIGAELIRSGTFPEVDKFLSHFNELYRSLTSAQVNLLESMVTAPVKCPPSVERTRLVDFGLIAEGSEGYYSIIPEYLKDYLVLISKPAAAPAEAPHASAASSGAESDRNGVVELVDEIFSKIEHINSQQESYGEEIVFDQGNEFTTQSKLRREVKCKEDYAIFSHAPYQILFEWTKIEGKTRQALFDISDTIGNHRFVKLADINRHTYGGAHSESHFESHPGAMTKEELLDEIHGSRQLPAEVSEFAAMQLKMLKLFSSFLDDVLAEINRNGRKPSCPQGKLMMGYNNSFSVRTHDGANVRLDNLHGFNPEYTSMSYDYRNGQEIFYEIKEVPDKFDRSRTMRFAVNVRPVNP